MQLKEFYKKGSLEYKKYVLKIELLHKRQLFQRGNINTLKVLLGKMW